MGSIILKGFNRILNYRILKILKSLEMLSHIMPLSSIYESDHLKRFKSKKKH